ncbi:MAG: cytochrome c [Gammaproteobacteria bacterium]|nr:cytochrome c [Gammaproteobacteria bacterium]MDP6731561.1 cytochrome c [Gammaproteobacteria bacterium]
MTSIMFAGVALIHGNPLQVVHAQQAVPGLVDGVYTQAQVARGEVVYQEQCASCHREDLTGQDMTPSLVGIGFSFTWQGKSLQELYNSMRFSMPQTAPGSLSDQAYADLTAMLLQRNGYPAGVTDLVADEERMAKIEITGGF